MRLPLLALALALLTLAAGGLDPPQQQQETQHAVCVITAGGGLVATANASVTRAVHCRGHTTEHLIKLEKEIVDQSHMIQQLLKMVEGLYKEHHNNKLHLRSPVDIASLHREKEDTLGSLHLLNNNEQNSRDAEIERYNSSLLTDPAGHLTFNYYWKIDHILALPENITVRSQSFYISAGSYRMFLIYWARSPVHMAGVGLARGEHDHSLQWPFGLAFRLSLLAKKQREYIDLSSPNIKPHTFVKCSNIHWQKPQMQDNEGCMVLSYRNDLLHTKDYLHRGKIILHLSVILV